MSTTVTHLLITRFNIYEPDWGIRVTEDWLEHRWPLFERTIKSVGAQSGRFTWLIAAHHKTNQKWVAKLNALDATILWVGDDWQASLRNWLDRTVKGPLMTTRLDNDDWIEPGFISAIQAAYDPTLHYYFIDAPHGWRGDRTYSEKYNPFLTLVEGSGPYQGVYNTPHGKAISRWIVRTIEGRWWHQVIHERNKSNAH